MYLVLTILTFYCVFLESLDIFDIKGPLFLSIHMASYGLPKQRVPVKSDYLGKYAVSLIIPLEYILFPSTHMSQMCPGT